MIHPVLALCLLYQSEPHPAGACPTVLKPQEGADVQAWRLGFWLGDEKGEASLGNGLKEHPCPGGKPPACTSLKDFRRPLWLRLTALSLWPAAYIATHTIPLEIGNALPERLVHLLYESQLGREDS